MATKKTEKAKAKVADKVKKAKAKIKAKTCKACALLVAILALAGCATSEPASRATTARYGDIIVKVADGATNNTISITLGDGAIASADSSGSTETMTSSPTNDVKPDIDVSVPVNKAGAAQSVGSVLGDAVARLIKGTTSGAAARSAASSSTCTDGSCSYDGACTDGSCTP